MKIIYGIPSKCSFGVHEVEYFSHIVSHEGVKVDPNKIKPMMESPVPKPWRILEDSWDWQ